jgi:hypothetical protein
MIQLQDGLHQRKMKTKAAHLVEVLEKAVNSSVGDFTLGIVQPLA